MKNFETYIFSKFPIICMNTHEIDRAVTEINKKLEGINSELDSFELDSDYIKHYGFLSYMWYPTTGIISTENKEERIRECGDIEEFFRVIMDSNTLPGIYIIPNIHMYLDEVMLPVITSYLLQHASNFNNKYIVLIGDISKLPQEVGIKTVSLDFNLPNTKEIKERITEFTKELGFKFNQKAIQKAAEASSGMSMQEIENAVKVSLVSTNGKRLDSDILYKEKARVVKRTGLLEVINTNENLDTLGGMFELKDWMKGVHKIFKYPVKAKKFGLETPKGTLVTGISGCGKTLFAKAIANYLEVPLFRCDIGRIFGGVVGETERNTRELWKLIESVHPCVILIDEIEKVMSGGKSSGNTDGGVTSRFIGTMLYHLEEKNVPAFFVATANDITSLSPELLRKGRWDEIWFVDIPNKLERKQIFSIHLSKVKRNPEEYITPKLLTETENFTGAEIEQIVHTALRRAFVEDRECTSKDLEEVAKNSVPLIETKKEEIEHLRKWAETRAKKATSQGFAKPQTKSKIVRKK